MRDRTTVLLDIVRDPPQTQADQSLVSTGSAETLLLVLSSQVVRESLSLLTARIRISDAGRDVDEVSYQPDSGVLARGDGTITIHVLP
jgi:hypothetical protein